MLLPEFTSDAEQELRYYTTLLNAGDKDLHEIGELEAKASEDYLLKVEGRLVRRGPITFAVLKDIVTNPLTWEKYCRPKCQMEAKEEARMPPAWDYQLRISQITFLGCAIRFYDYIPFSDCTFRGDDYDALLDYIKEGRTYRKFEGLRTYWFKIRRWLIDLAINHMVLRGDKPYTDLFWVMDWWRSFDPTEPPSWFHEVSFQRRLHGKPSKATLAIIRAQTKEFDRLSSIVRGIDGDPPVTCDLPQRRSDSPCVCTICKRSLSVTEKNEDRPQQLWMKCGPPRHSTPLSQPGRMGQSLWERVDQTPTFPPPLRRCRDRDEEGGEEVVDLHQHPRKKQRTTHSYDYPASDTDSIMTDVAEGGPPDSSYENDMSEDEDFWSAKSVAELSILSVDN